MSSKSIQLARALALGWRESEKFTEFSKQNNLFGSLLESFDDMEYFSKIINAVYHQELLNFKELRFIEVKIDVDQVDMRLSTTRTRWDMRSPPEKKNPPVILSLMEVHIDIVDPIVPASYKTDKVRDVSMRINRMRLSAGETSTNTTIKSLLNKVIWDQCWIIEKSYQEFEQEAKARKYERKINSELDLLNSTHLNPSGLSNSQSYEKIKQFINNPMIKLHIHEDPEYNITMVFLLYYFNYYFNFNYYYYYFNE